MKKYILFICVCLLPGNYCLQAQYVIKNSVLANGGQTLSDSENYNLNGTLGQVLIGITTGEADVHKLGFWYTFSDLAINSQSPRIKFQHSIELYQNFPNPFNQSTTIEYSLNEEAFISLKICDILGREISVLYNGMKEAGSYSVRFDASGLPGGAYICRLQSDDIILTKKIFLLK